MKKTFVRDLKQGQRTESDSLIRNKTLRVPRNGAAYLDLQLQGASGAIPARLWGASGEARSPLWHVLWRGKPATIA